MPASASLGELWAGANANKEGPRVARRIEVSNLLLGGAGRVTLRESHVDHLTAEPGVELVLDACRVVLLDLSQSSAAALIVDFYKPVRELLKPTELVVGQSQIRKAYGIPGGDVVDTSVSDEFFISDVSDDRRGIYVNQRDLSPPEDDRRLKWVESFGLDVWRDFIKRMEAEGRIVLDRVVTGGSQKLKVCSTRTVEES